jgi:hypothetical protein
MKYNQRDILLKEEEAYKNEIYPTKMPKSSKEIKQQLNNSFRSAYSNISKNNFSTSNFFESNIKRIESNKKMNDNYNNNEKYLDIIPDINYNNEIINNNNNEAIKIRSSNIELNYCVGIISKMKYCFCFHSKEKFFIYISKNIIILEDFSIEKKRKQKILTDSEFELQGIKLSANNKLLMCWTNLTMLKCNSYILFYQYENYYPKFTLLNKLSFDKGYIIDCEFSPDNNLIIIISKFNDLYFISLFSFIENKIITTTFLKNEIIKIEFNKYITGLEFCCLGKNLITLWRINPFEQKLEYQNVSLKSKNDGSFEYSTINYFQINNNENILLLIGCSNSNIICIDNKTNNELYIFNNINMNKQINEIITNNDIICFISDNKIKYCNIKSIPIQTQNIENCFNNMNFTELFFDSEIQTINYNHIKGLDLLILTSKSNLYYSNLEENISIKLYSFIEDKNDILNVKIIKKNINTNEDDIYYMITLHKNNEIKIWSIPDYNLIYNFETINEEIKYIDTALDELFFLVSYNSNNIRFFNNEKFLGKFNSENLGSYSPILFIKILPDSKYIYLVDESNIIYLIFLEQKEPLIIQFHIIAKISYPIKDFNISRIDSYNLFYVNIQNLYINIYNRKYVNIIKNNKNDMNNNNIFMKNTPEFYIKDKINLIDCFMGHKNIDNNIIIYFSLDIKQKNLIFILSKRNKMILVRNFENHTNIKNILFTEDILDFSLTNNNYYMFFLFNNKIQKTSINNILIENFEYANIEELCEKESNLIGLKSDQYKLRISYDNLFMIIFSNNSLFIYKI